MVGFVSGRVRRGRFTVGMCSAISAKCLDVFDEVGLVSRRVRRGRLNFGTCLARSD